MDFLKVAPWLGSPRMPTWWPASNLFWWDAGSQFSLFTVYDKNEMLEVTPLQRKALKEMMKKELDARRKR